MIPTKLPKIIKDFCIYLTTITGKSQRTRKEYEYDLVLTFRFLKAIPHIGYDDVQGWIVSSGNIDNGKIPSFDSDFVS